MNLLFGWFAYVDFQYLYMAHPSLEWIFGCVKGMIFNRQMITSSTKYSYFSGDQFRQYWVLILLKMSINLVGNRENSELKMTAKVLDK